ncbi:hypothetical protein BF93_18130 [Brachybacterium phenoliresistens]|uniref:Mycothiol-dependent maleylpyruvate isomerase metal-binding domain-containing protein n=1 Tax=Brachybacterium phenoliresistens TaxID=396014 RepID=Z9JTL7_9MICO|nr:maleylpyruvate isomerase N-terminal domain-containing protein [Brachybacterium phenoliresistens]EWS81092.1 hypothetical protein BF93_18130 [Brachybacterium phenoliresistens]
MDATTLIGRESQRLADLLVRADPAAAVPTCPGWDAAELLAHVTQVHGFWAEVLASRASTDAQIEALESSLEPPPKDPEALAAARAEATAALLAQLGTRADEEPAWSWLSSDQSLGFTRRMQLHEATMHRVDAELTCGQAVTEPGEEVAVDGIAHCADVMWEADHQWTSMQRAVVPVALLVLRPQGGPETFVELSRAAATGEDEEDIVVARRAPDQDLAPGTALRELPRAEATGSPVALYLWTWGRGLALEALAGGAESVDVTGDPDAVAALEALLRRGLQ